MNWLSNPLGAIQNIRNKVFKKVGWLQRQYPDAKESYLALKRELLEELGVTPQTTYLYIQGHHLFDKVVVPVMQKVCTKLVRDREQEIRYQSRHSTQMHNELSCYTSLPSLSVILPSPFKPIRITKESSSE